MEYFKNEFAMINYLDDVKTVELVWKQTTNSQKYREIFAKGVEALEKYQISNWLSDTTDQGLVSPEDRKWLESHMIPTAVQKGLRNIAVLVSKDVFKKYYVDSVRKHVEKSHLCMQYFDKREDAIQWLNEINNARLAQSA
ncbi:hypothetical protein OKW21_001865 [Catalinimonas alkaloidigena]|uniref:STAS/SEC14 domain-containing protein n=1 Tax=Catalinimonas alkaloidigena TaxID=1075417 RepID=UPI002406538B|nr:STAS/SEC14 domain-containing protein [Catalinimonas alkaloidigena]MDF9796602.1 hypothetical protein [Catalinimonas alkaloidigena]